MKRPVPRVEVTVTAAVLEREGRVLVARRKPGRRLEGKWEFPGGKVEPGETPRESLRRELFEEFGVDTQIGAPLAVNRHDYGDMIVELMAYRAILTGGEFVPVDHDEVRWVLREELSALDLAPADVPIARALAGNSSGPGGQRRSHTEHTEVTEKINE